MTKTINKTDVAYRSHFATIDGARLHYIEQGVGDPILLLHSVPASSYVWRNIIPHLSTLGRCIAPDLIGMGQSDKPDIAYSISDHISYIEKFIDQLKLKNITLVLHGWGSIIGFDYAMRHEKNCKGLVFYEAYLRSMQKSDLSLPYQEQIISFEEHDNIQELFLNGASFVDKVMPQYSLNGMDERDLSHYREAFKAPGSGKVLAQYWQELPRGDSKSKVDNIIAHYSKKLIKSQLPKLMLYSVPGFITTIATVMWAKEHLPNLEIVDIGEDLHYAQESNPTLMGETISIWLQGVEQG